MPELNFKNGKTEFFIDDKPCKLDGIFCDSCGSDDVWYPNYIGLIAPNRECRKCGAKWIVSPQFKLDIVSTYRFEAHHKRTKLCHGRKKR